MRFVTALALPIIVVLFLQPSRIAGSPQESSTTVYQEAVSQDEMLWLTIRGDHDPERRAEIIQSFYDRFKVSPYLDAVCELEFSSILAEANREMTLSAAQRALERPCMQVTACEAILEAIGESANQSIVLGWLKRCYGEAKAALDRPTVAQDENRPEQARRLARQIEYKVFLWSWNAPERESQRYLVELRELNPESEYIGALHDRALQAAMAGGNPTQVEAKARAVLTTEPNHPGALLALAGSDLQQRRNLEEIVPLTARALEELNRRETLARSREAGSVEAADLRRRQRGQALWLQGMHFATGRRWKEADTRLRQALPLIQEDPSMLAAALYHLGLANSQLDRNSESLKEIRDAIRFLEQCTAIQGPYRAHAVNLLAAVQASASN